jgi:hypothetical protein
MDELCQFAKANVKFLSWFEKKTVVTVRVKNNQNVRPNAKYG